MMNTEKKLQTLRDLYDLHAEYTDTLKVSCMQKCSGCCTRNVTMTSLEALNFITGLGESKRKYVTEKVKSGHGAQCYRPSMTTNGWSNAIARGESPAEDENDPSWGGCPIIENDLCPAYSVRPFACRAMVSSSPCLNAGHADVSPFTLTVNHVFMQYIEYLDSDGFSGNFSDMWIFINQEENLKKYSSGNVIETLAPHILKNCPPKMLMVPPEHQGKIRDLLTSINQLLQPKP